MRVVWRLRANVRRLRTIRAARTDSLRIVSRGRGARNRRVPAAVRDARTSSGSSRAGCSVRGRLGNRLAERGHLLRLQELMVDVTCLVVQFLSFADVAHQRFDAKAAVPGSVIGARRQFIQTAVPSARRRREQVSLTEPSVRGVPRMRRAPAIDETLVVEGRTADRAFRSRSRKSV